MRNANSKKNNEILKSISDKIDNFFLSELEKRSKSFKNRKAKTYTWEETKEAARKSVKL
jgi:hypothetical protein